jgi:hypothetical protein
VRGLEPIGGELERELGRLGPPGAIGTVVAAWPDAVGAAIAANAWPARIARDGTLHVSTSSSAWAFELTHLEETVRSRLADRLGAACPPRLRFAPGRLPEAGAEAEEARETAPAPPSPAALAQAAELASAIDGEELREAVARAAAAALAGTDRRPDDRRF